MSDLAMFSTVEAPRNKRKRNLYLDYTRCSSAGVPDLLYSFLVIEAKSILGGTFGAANQLSGSLSYALGRLRRLRADAAGVLNGEPFHLFGAVSSGDKWRLYMAYEVDAAASQMECVGLADVCDDDGYCLDDADLANCSIWSPSGPAT